MLTLKLCQLAVKFPQSDDCFRVAKMIALPTVRGFHNLSDVLPKERDWLGSRRLSEVLESNFFVCLESVWSQAAGPLDS